ncbi:prepilin-type N-terminal cleavage/methylation domain-containing protein [Patescibacteria group bacterium]|nr:prepilin-type N-terminal cleavage/methylation domain-containing protein [Patescibacteria group bacterium]MBU4057417.1 prepilin-type N-terminal cleavage/methylation domain-containing protein [Patescibacteria group bacterium]MBU4115702.1 prepilin-type N-terminal cleavage/methylation domain-containing protein [Patescibacteria group bacterium]
MKQKSGKNSSKNYNKGFTLVEMMVAVALFSVVMVIGVGSLLSMISANKKSQSLQLVMSNLGFAIEDITRTMRVGTNYHCGSGDIREPKDCNGGSNYVAFEPTGGDPDSTNDQVVYRLNGTQIEKSTSGGVNNSFIAITAPEITIESLSFYVQGSETIGEGDNKQPKVLIVLSGHAGENEKTKSNFNIQTMVSQRILDF